jgi:UDP-N-acetylmuramoyl-tripeptide--D-alanyl-D-alanine ligase
MKEILKNIIKLIIVWEARLVLKKYKPKIIAIAGSVGKTSTKDAVFTILSKHKKVRKNEKNFNSEVGLPLTVLGLPYVWDDPFLWFLNIGKGFLLLIKKQNYPDVLILEIGVRKPNDIKKNILPWLKSDVLIITRFPEKPVHTEFFDNPDKLIEEKSNLIKALKKGGLMILNQDDDKVYALHDKSKERVVSYGQDENSTYRILYPSYNHININNKDVPLGINFKIQHRGHVFPVALPNVLGLHNMMQATSAIACANELGIDILESIKNISEYKTPPSRLSLLEGINNSLIIDDTYNSSPVAVCEALEILKEFKGKRKITILGDMLELGKYTEEEHIKIGREVPKLTDVLITVGPRAKMIAKEAQSQVAKENIHMFEGVKDAISFVSGVVGEGDVFLVKGSQKMRLEKLVEAIMKDKDKKESLLCRQDKEWIK